MADKNKQRRKEKKKMLVKELKEELEKYNDNAEVVVVDWANGRVYEPSIGSDDEDEFTDYCRIGMC